MVFPIQQVHNIKFLGLYLDENLSWKSHILTLLKKPRISIGVISKLKYYVNTENLVQIYHSLIKSHLRYGILIRNNGSKCKVATAIEKLNSWTFLGHFPGLWAISTGLRIWFSISLFHVPIFMLIIKKSRFTILYRWSTGNLPDIFKNL